MNEGKMTEGEALVFSALYRVAMQSLTDEKLREAFLIFAEDSARYNAEIEAGTKDVREGMQKAMSFLCGPSHSKKRDKFDRRCAGGGSRH